METGSLVPGLQAKYCNVKTKIKSVKWNILKGVYAVCALNCQKSVQRVKITGGFKLKSKCWFFLSTRSMTMTMTHK